MFNLLIDYLTRHVNPMIVLKLGVVCSVVAGLCGAGLLLCGDVLVGIAIMLIAIPVGILSAFEVLYLSHDDG